MIKKATIKDYNAIEPMARAFYEESKYGSMYGIDVDDDSIISFLVMFLSDEDKVILFEEGKGMIMGIVDQWFLNKKHTVVREVAWYVHPEKRDGFTASKLLKSFERWAIDKGAKAYFMSSIKHLDGERIGKFYEKKGIDLIEYTYGKAL